MGKIDDLFNNAIDVAPKAAATYKDISEARLANSTRHLVNDVKREIPEVADAIKTNMASLTRLQETLAATTLDNSKHINQVASSKMQLNGTLERTAISKAATLEKTADAITVMTNAVAGQADAIAAASNVAVGCMKEISDHTSSIVREIHGIRVIGQSLVDHISYYGRWMQAASIVQIAQNEQANRLLKEISKHLEDHNNLVASGSGGSDGFALHVYDFIKMRIDEIDPTEVGRHRVFVYHPDTNWYGAFHRLISANPLPPTFCAKSNNLDAICLYMEEVRAQLKTESDCGKDVVLHLLIPSWYRIPIKEPLHFPDSLQPFRVEGETHKGKPLVEFNLPAAPVGLLNGVANIRHPIGLDNTTAAGVSMAITLPVVGWGVNGVCLATGVGLGVVTGLGAFVALPTWLLTAGPAMGLTLPAMYEGIFDALPEEDPRILGSKKT